MSIYKKILSVLAVAGLGFLVAVPGAFAAGLTYSADSIVTIGSASYTILSGSTATSVVVGSSTLTVVIPASSTFTLRSPNAYKLTNDQALTQDCTSSTNQVTATGPLTVIITPDTTACTVPVVNSGGGGGGGASGTPAPPANPPVSPAPSSVLSPTIDLSARFALYNGTIYDKSTGTAFTNAGSFFQAAGVAGFNNLKFDTSYTPPAGSVTASTGFTNALKVGLTKGNGIVALQMYLNTHGFVIASKGAGSPGHETNILGTLTKNALKKWQKSVGLKASGTIDKATISYLASIGY